MSYDLTQWDEGEACEAAHMFIAGYDLGREPDERAWVEIREVEWIAPPKPKSVVTFKKDEIPF